MYKTEDDGTSFTSRGVRTSANEGFTIGGLSHQCFDVDAEGAFLYLAVLDDTPQPQVLRMQTDLNDPVALVYDPGSGNSINVQCGDLSQYFVWAAGDFGSNDRVASADDGVYWYVRNFEPFDYWAGSAGPLKVGPHGDEIVSVFTNDDFTLHESYFVGESLYWMDMPYAPFGVGAFDRQMVNFEEIIAGVGESVYWYSGSNQVQYSPNSGIRWGDVSTGLTAVQVTSVIYG